MFVIIDIVLAMVMELEKYSLNQLTIPLSIFLFSLLYFKRDALFSVPKPAVASTLSLLLPGFGHIYLGYIKTGIVIYLGWIVGCYLFLSQETAIIFLFLVSGFPILDGRLVFKAPNFKVARYRKSLEQRLTVAKYNMLKFELDKGFMPAVDTNVMMHEPLVLITIHRDTDSKLYVSKKVINELDGLKNNKKRETRERAQLAFDIIELFQKDGRLVLVEIPSRNYREIWNLSGSSDDIILSSYLFEIDKKKLPIAFYSNDKGARITARNTGMPLLREGLA